MHMSDSKTRIPVTKIMCMGEQPMKTTNGSKNPQLHLKALQATTAEDTSYSKGLCLRAPVTIKLLHNRHVCGNWSVRHMRHSVHQHPVSTNRPKRKWCKQSHTCQSWSRS